MTDIGVAADAGKFFAGPAHHIDIMHDILMTFAARVLRHALAARLHANGIVKMARSEGKRMEKTVIGFSEILSEHVGRRVTIVASRDGTMATLDPAIEMVLHDVTIGARSRIVAQVRRTFCIDESVSAETCRATHHQRDSDPKQNRQPGRSGDKLRGVLGSHCLRLEAILIENREATIGLKSYLKRPLRDLAACSELVVLVFKQNIEGRERSVTAGDVLL